MVWLKGVYSPFCAFSRVCLRFCFGTNKFHYMKYIARSENAWARLPSRVSANHVMAAELEQSFTLEDLEITELEHAAEHPNDNITS